MGFPMNGDRRLFIWRFNQAKDLAGRLVKPVAQVLDAILLLRLEIGRMGLANRIGGEPLDMGVHIHIQWHDFSPYEDAASCERAIPEYDDMISRQTRYKPTAANAQPSLNTPCLFPRMCARIAVRRRLVYLPNGRLAGRFVWVRRAGILKPALGRSPVCGWRPPACGRY